MEDDNMKRDLLSNESIPDADSHPPPYNTLVGPGQAPSTDPQFYPPAGPGLVPTFDSQPHPQQQQYLQQQYPQQQFPATTQQPVAQYPATGPQVVHHVQAVSTPACPSEVFAREECFAECIRFWWCRPIGWLAKAELAKARALYLAGDYEQAQAAATRANVWSTVGLICGVLIVALVAVAMYFLIAYGIN